MNLLAFYIHSLNPIAIPFPDNFPLKGIYWYGLAYFTSLLLGLLMLHLYNKKQIIALNAEDQSNCVFALMIGLLVGGRFGYYLLYTFRDFCNDPWQVLQIWHGGMASHGGFVGASIGLWLYCRCYKKNLFQLADILVTIIPFGFLLGRLANFINGELWGHISYVPWAVIFPQSAPSPYLSLASIPPRHPSQLYEAFLEGLCLALYLNSRLWYAKLKNKKLIDGQLTAEFFIGYALARIFVECFREPDAPLIGALSRGQFYSLFLLAFGIGLFAFTKNKSTQKII